MTNIEKTIKYCPVEMSLDLITKKMGNTNSKRYDVWKKTF